MNSRGELILSIHGLVVDTPTRRIMIDTCIGNDKSRLWPQMDQLQTGFLDNLEQAGFPRDSFEIVLCTHLHVDHVGWNTMLRDGKWIPTFPNARYLIGRIEFEYWSGGQGIDPGSGWDVVQRQAFDDSVKPIWDAGLVDLVETTHLVCEEVSLVPSPGHSPGHVCIRVRSLGSEALITGDFTHHPCQLVHPDWGLELDYDADQAARTRKALFEELADGSVLVVGTHWAGATAGRVVRNGESLRLVC